jgi:hypothetical protein
MSGEAGEDVVSTGNPISHSSDRIQSEKIEN